MVILKRIAVLSAFISFFIAQNDVDYLRYSRTNVGGSSRFVGMGGAMGALGADMSCASFNPAALGLFTRLDLNLGFGLMFDNRKTSFENKITAASKMIPVFSTFGVALPYPSKRSQDVRNVLCYNINQLVNYNSRTIIELPETKATMNRDMLLNITDPNKPNGISPFYEGLGFNSYLLDFDTVTKKYFSFSDTAIPVKLHRNLHRKGRINESTFSFAQSVGDEWYWGIGLGIQNIRFENELNHSEYDDQNKMQIITTGSTVSSTYITEPPYYYTPLYGFKQFTYTEYFKTTGKGYNVKGGIIYRHSPELRLGFYAHSPTFFDLSDDYNYYMKTTFDGTNTPMEAKYPSTSEKGVFNYSMKTPWKMGGSAGYIWNKKVALGLDAEWISYGSGNLSSDDFPSAFDGVNEIIRRKYKSTFNTRFGVEYNAFPYFFRAGYIQYGSPYGKMFRGAEVMNILTAGFGFRKTYFYVDFSYIYRLEQINYYPYTKTNELAQINAQTGVFQFSFGYKF